MAGKNTVMHDDFALVLILLISGSEARPEIYDRMCPGVCRSFVKPDCNGLCHGLGFPGGYCKAGNTCCCKKKTSGPVHVPATA